MPTLRQLATQASEALTSQSVSVQDLIEIADSLGISLPGRDGGDSADAIAPTVSDLIQIATARNVTLKVAAEGYTPTARSNTPTPKPRSNSKSRKPAAPKGQPPETTVETPPSAQAESDKQDLQLALLRGVKKGLQLLKAEKQGEQMVREIAAGLRELDPRSPMQQFIAAQVYEIQGDASDLMRLEGEDEAVLMLNADVSELSLDEAFETVVTTSLRLADYATPALPAAR